MEVRPAGARRTEDHPSPSPLADRLVTAPHLRFPSARRLTGGGSAALAAASENEPAPSVLLVGRHQLFAEALAANLRDIGLDVVGSVPGVSSMNSALPAPDVGVVDLRPHCSSDLAEGSELLRKWPQLKLLALTPPGDHFCPRAAVSEGFHGCLSKDAPLDRLAGSILAVFAGTLVTADDHVPSGRRPRDRAWNSTAARARNLTPRELEVLALLVKGRRSAEIARSLNIGLNTVRTHVQNIPTKLPVHSRLEAASVAVKYGLVPVPGGSSRALIPLR